MVGGKFLYRVISLFVMFKTTNTIRQTRCETGARDPSFFQVVPTSAAATTSTAYICWNDFRSIPVETIVTIRGDTLVSLRETDASVRNPMVDSFDTNGKIQSSEFGRRCEPRLAEWMDSENRFLDNCEEAIHHFLSSLPQILLHILILLIAFRESRRTTTTCLMLTL